jgi:hypothetical protein
MNVNVTEVNVMAAMAVHALAYSHEDVQSSVEEA